MKTWLSLFPSPPASFGPWQGLLASLGLLLALDTQPAASAPMGMLQVRNGYFWDSVRAEYFIARGIAYQTWNPPVGANQSLAQIDYDLREFRRMRANSVRCEFTWGELQRSATEYDWSKTDDLVARAEALGLRLFVLIGYQYPPAWFPASYRGVNDQFTNTNDPALVASNALSNVINYEHPEARRIYSNHIAAVTARYRRSPAIGGWILGNEYAYYDLWEDPGAAPVHRFIGYDPISQERFRDFLREHYRGDVGALNVRWGTSHTGFDAIEMPRPYPLDRRSAAYHDLIQWRKRSIADYVAIGALAAQKSDPDHLRTYSMVGAVFSNFDANHTCEDARTIVARCAEVGAPLHFWSVNNYPWPASGSELRSCDFGIAKYQSEIGLPILVSETGFTSTENLWPEEPAGARQAVGAPSALWESLMSGAVGVHLFHWNDRNQFTPGYFERERGFGIVTETRKRKGPVYDNIVRAFRQMENLHLERLLGGSSNPPPDIQFLWSVESDMVWPRANQENCMVWGALKRLGYQPAIIDDEGFARGDFHRAHALILSRAYQLMPSQLDRLARDVLPAGVHLHAQADLPGQFDAYHRPNPNWSGIMESVFGVGVETASPGLDGYVTNFNLAGLTVQGQATLGPITPWFRRDFMTWKIWHGTRTVSGRTILTHTGRDGGQPPAPALVVKDHGPGRGRTAIQTFALGDTYAVAGASRLDLYRLRREILGAIYQDHFKIQPGIGLRGPGANHVIPDFRLCSDGSILVSLLNESTNAATVTLAASGILTGRQVEDLLRGGVLAESSSGELELTVPGDDLVLLHAYDSGAAGDSSLVNASREKIWFDAAPLLLWPQPQPADVAIGYDLGSDGLRLEVALEQSAPVTRVIARSEPVSVNGAGAVRVPLVPPDADANDPACLSTRDGAEYRLWARLLRAGDVVGACSLSTTVSWGVRPARPLPAPVVAGTLYPIELRWEDLPSAAEGDPMPLDRAALWDSAEALQQWYQIILEVRSRGETVASERHLTRTGNGRRMFNVLVPPGSMPPFTWDVRLETAPDVQSQDVEESFEGRLRGARWPNALATEFLVPWTSYQYHSPGEESLWQNEGVHLSGSHGSQSGFLVVTNPPAQDFSGFGLRYRFPEDWALPQDPAAWSAYACAFDFREHNGLAHVLELQVVDAAGGRIGFAQDPVPSPGGWSTVEASLDRFRVAEPGSFNPGQIRELVVNVWMLVPEVQYVGSFDHIRFSGPDQAIGAGDTLAAYSSGNDSAGMLAVTPDGREIVIAWYGNGQLQVASDVTGPWRDVESAQSPLRVPATPGRGYFRLVSP